jgi:hypothetical protein
LLWEKNLPHRYAQRGRKGPDSMAEAAADATAALAHRLRIAASTPWDGDRCDTEAATFIAEMVTRGWTPPRPVPDWRSTRRTPADPTIAALAAARARQAIRANRAGTRPGATHSDPQPQPDPNSADNNPTPQKGTQP